METTMTSINERCQSMDKDQLTEVHKELFNKCAAIENEIFTFIRDNKPDCLNGFDAEPGRNLDVIFGKKNDNEFPFKILLYHRYHKDENGNDCVDINMDDIFVGVPYFMSTRCFGHLNKSVTRETKREYHSIMAKFYGDDGFMDKLEKFLMVKDKEYYSICDEMEHVKRMIDRAGYNERQAEMDRVDWLREKEYAMLKSADPEDYVVLDDTHMMDESTILYRGWFYRLGDIDGKRIFTQKEGNALKKAAKKEGKHIKIAQVRMTKDVHGRYINRG